MNSSLPRDFYQSDSSPNRNYNTDSVNIKRVETYGENDGLRSSYRGFRDSLFYSTAIRDE